MQKLLLSVFLLSVLSASADEAALPAEEQKATVRPPILAAVEKELDRLSRQAKEEAGPDWPRPSSEVAFMLLAGLAAQGSPVKQFSADDLRQLGITSTSRDRVQLFTVADDARITIVATWIQDKSGSYTRKVALLHRLREKKWVERGSGTTVAAK